MPTNTRSIAANPFDAARSNRTSGARSRPPGGTRWPSSPPFRDALAARVRRFASPRPVTAVFIRAVAARPAHAGGDRAYGPARAAAAPALPPFDEHHGRDARQQRECRTASTAVCLPPKRCFLPCQEIPVLELGHICGREAAYCVIRRHEASRER